MLVAAVVAVVCARLFAESEAGRSFLAAYPGHAPMPESAPVGVPAWLNWSHFFNFFLMALIIRTGWLIRTERRPEAYWSPKWNPGRKISLNIWLHQCLDALWVLNGVVFVVLLFTTGQWMKVVPTSVDVFPNAISSAVQYLSLNWPTENGWVHYNALQQLAYFVTIFVAAPLAVLSGVRMSGIWPEKNATLNRIYPAPVARKLHLPVMLYFVAFIAVHLVLVFATGALRNLNHMFAARGSADPQEFAGTWWGFGFMLLALVVTAAAVWAARPMFVGPLARLSGNVTAR